MKNPFVFGIGIMLIMGAAESLARQGASGPEPAVTKFSSDAGDGTYFNNVIAGDFPDVDMVRVGDKYYLMSTTMHHVPGATLLESEDLVNWSYCSNPLETIEDEDCYNLKNGKRRYAGGMWASALAYHAGTFYIVVNTVSENRGYVAFLLTAKDPKGPWEKKCLNRGFYDCGLLFDGGKIYIVHGHPRLHISELDADFSVVKEQFVAEGNHPEWHDCLEGSRLYHIGEYYYIYSTYGGWPSGQTCFRSKDIWGPYEERLVVSKFIDDRPNTVHQGCLIETQTGEWWTMFFQDMGAIGRCPNLQKVTWKDGWPTIGKDGDGRPEKRRAKPKLPRKKGAKPGERHLATTDGFRGKRLGHQWQWNHQPDNSKWSLTERPGFLRLHTASVTKNFYDARNSLTQRILCRMDGEGRMQPGSGTVRLETKGMRDGDIAGIAVLQSPYAMVGVVKRGKRKFVVWRTDTLDTGENAPPKKSLVEPIRSDVTAICLRASVDPNNGEVQMSWSYDNKSFTPIGEKVRLHFSLLTFVGMRYAIYNYATKSLGGHADVDWFVAE